MLDFATSKIAQGKTRVAYNKGVAVEPGNLIDDKGEPTTEPRYTVVEPIGALLPFGEHKGAGPGARSASCSAARSPAARPVAPSATVAGASSTACSRSSSIPRGSAPPPTSRARWKASSPTRPRRRRSPDSIASGRRASPSARRERDACATALPVDSVTWGEIVAAGAKVGAAARVEALAAIAPARGSPGDRHDDALPLVRARSGAAAPSRLSSPRSSCTVASAAPPLDKLRVPAGFRVELLTDAVPNARQMALGRNVRRRASSTSAALAGKVYAVRVRRSGARATVHIVASGLQLPTGVAWRDGSALRRRAARACCASMASTTSSLRRRRRSSSPTAFPRRRTTAAASSPSAPTASSTWRSARRATSACPTIVMA